MSAYMCHSYMRSLYQMHTLRHYSMENYSSYPLGKDTDGQANRCDRQTNTPMYLYVLHLSPVNPLAQLHA